MSVKRLQALHFMYYTEWRKEKWFCAQVTPKLIPMFYESLDGFNFRFKYGTIFPIPRTLTSTAGVEFAIRMVKIELDSKNGIFWWK